MNTLEDNQYLLQAAAEAAGRHQHFLEGLPRSRRLHLANRQSSREETVLSLIEEMTDPTDEMITLFYGDSVKKEEAELLRSTLQSRHDGREVELFYGGQPYGHYVISVE